MTDEFPFESNGYPGIQASFFLDPNNNRSPQIVFRAEDGDDLQRKINSLRTSSDGGPSALSDFYELIDEVRSAAMAAGILNGGSAPAQADQTAAVPTQTGPVTGTGWDKNPWASGLTAPSCAHGPRVPASGFKNGRMWKAWFCTADRNAGQCSAQWVK